MKGSLNDAISFLKTNDNFTLLCHINPDGDTLGSAFGLYYTLKSIGKKVNISSPDGWPKKYEYFYSLPQPIFSTQHYVSVDVASPSLLGSNVDKNIDLAIDHHLINTIDAKYYYIDETAAATCELIFRIATELLNVIDKKTADAIFTGLSSDTGCFRYSNTNHLTHYSASKLIEYGASSSYINKTLFEQKSIERLNLERYALNNFKLLMNGKLTLLYLSVKTMEKLGANNETFEGLPALLKSVEGVDIAITIKEKRKHLHKVSVRTSNKIDASLFAKEFGGGGHARAAGFAIEGNKKKAIKLILNSVKKVV